MMARILLALALCIACSSALPETSRRGPTQPPSPGPPPGVTWPVNGAIDIGGFWAVTWTSLSLGPFSNQHTGTVNQHDNGVHFSGNTAGHTGKWSSMRNKFDMTDLSDFEGVWLSFDMLSGGALKAPLGIGLTLGNNLERRKQYTAAVGLPRAASSGETQQFSVFVPFTDFTWHPWKGSGCPLNNHVCSDCKLDLTRINQVQVDVMHQSGDFTMHLTRIHAVRRKSDITVEVPSVYEQSMTNTQAEELLTNTVHSGTDVFNHGIPELCGAIYEAASRTLVNTQGVSAEAIAPVRAAMAYMQDTTHGVNQHGTEAAWILRRGFDHMMAQLKGHAPPSEAHYPAVARGDWVTNGGHSSGHSSGDSTGHSTNALASGHHAATHSEESAGSDNTVMIVVVIVAGVVATAATLAFAYVYVHRTPAAPDVAMPVQGIGQQQAQVPPPVEDSTAKVEFGGRSCVAVHMGGGRSCSIMSAPPPAYPPPANHPISQPMVQPPVPQATLVATQQTMTTAQPVKYYN